MMGMAEQEQGSVAARVQAHRARLRAQGLRPVQIWVPDVRSPQFAVAAHTQSAAIAASEGDAEDQAFVDAISWDLAASDDGGESISGGAPGTGGE
jgi:hypothetical protein